MSDIKTILCHAGDQAAALLVNRFASNGDDGPVCRRVQFRERVRYGAKPIYDRRVVELRYHGQETTTAVEAVTLLPSSISKATFLERVHLMFSQVFYVTVMSNHGEWLDLEPEGTVNKPYVLIEPGNGYSRISGFEAALALNDLRSLSAEDPALLNAVDRGVRIVAEHILGPRSKTRTTRARNEDPAEV